MTGPDPAGHGLRVLAEARWPDGPDDTLPRIAGFAASSFSPLVAETADRCLRARYGDPPATAAPRTALLLASPGGDLATADALAEAVASGSRVPPLLFYQSNPNAVLGHLAARWRLDGPVVALGPVVGPGAEEAPGVEEERLLLDQARLLIDDGEAEQVLAVTAHQGPPDRATAALLAPAAPAPRREREP